MSFLVGYERPLPRGPAAFLPPPAVPCPFALLCCALSFSRTKSLSRADVAAGAALLCLLRGCEKPSFVLLCFKAGQLLFCGDTTRRSPSPTAAISAQKLQICADALRNVRYCITRGTLEMSLLL